MKAKSKMRKLCAGLTALCMAFSAAAFSLGTQNMYAFADEDTVTEEETQSPEVPDTPDAPEEPKEPRVQMFSDAPGYTLEGQNQYYSAPVAQGDNNVWLYYGKVDGELHEMIDNAPGTGNAWLGTATSYMGVWWRQDCGPAGGDDVVFAWKAPEDGLVTFTGKVFKDGGWTDGSDGIRLKSYYRENEEAEPEELYNEVFTEEFTVYFTGKPIPVKAGEIYYIAVDQYGHDGWDTTKVWMKTTFSDSFFVAKENIGYTLEGQNQYYVAPPEENGSNNFWMYYGKVEEEGNLHEMVLDPAHKETGNHWSAPAPVPSYFGVWWRQEFTPAGGQDAVIVWKAPEDGQVTFMGKIFKDGGWTDGSDGVKIKVYYSAGAEDKPVEIYNETYNEAFEIYFNGETLKVKQGVTYYIAIDQNGHDGWDTTKVWWKAEFYKEGEGPLKPLTHDNWYHDEEQGIDGWYYAYGSIEKYALMEWSVFRYSPRYVWNGMGDYHYLAAGNDSPGGMYANLIIKVCESDGVINLDGGLEHSEAGGDGGNAKIYHNDKVLWEYGFTSKAERVDLTDELHNISVKKGDLIVYYLDCGGERWNAFDNFKFGVTLTYTEKTGEELSETSSYIHPVSKLELMGVKIIEPTLDENGDYGNAGGTNLGLIIGLSVGGAVVVAAAVVVTVILLNKKKKTTAVQDGGNNGQEGGNE